MERQVCVDVTAASILLDHIANFLVRVNQEKTESHALMVFLLEVVL